MDSGQNSAGEVYLPREDSFLLAELVKREVARLCEPGAGDFPPAACSAVLALFPPALSLPAHLRKGLTWNVKRQTAPSVLDVGTGSGILAAAAKQAGAKLAIATDINLNAAKEASKLGMPSLCCDLLTAIKPSAKFDLIVSNPPYLPSDGRTDNIIWSGGYEGMEVIMELIKQARPHLAEGGAILFIYSSYTKEKKLRDFLSRLGFGLEILAEKRVFFESVFVGRASIESPPERK